MGETCAMCGLELASIETRNLYHSGEALKASDYRGKCLRDITCWQRGYDREKARADAANSKLAATDVERLQALSALAAANARADAAEVELRVSGAAYGSLQDALTVARRECEGLRKALRESRQHIVAGRRFAGLSEDGPEVRRIDAALAAPAPAPGEET